MVQTCTSGTPTRCIVGISWYHVYTMYILRGGIYLVYTRYIQWMLKIYFHAFMCKSIYHVYMSKYHFRYICQNTNIPCIYVKIPSYHVYTWIYHVYPWSIYVVYPGIYHVYPSPRSWIYMVYTWIYHLYSMYIGEDGISIIANNRNSICWCYEFTVTEMYIHVYTFP